MPQKLHRRARTMGEGMRSTLVARVKKLERFATARQKRADTAVRHAIIQIGDCDSDGAQHLVMVSSGEGGCSFEQQPGPGLQLSDFGKFVWVLYLTSAEANA
jgi:hypothetical protein